MIRKAEPDDIPRLQEIFRRSSWSNVGDRALLREHPEFLVWSGEPALEGRTTVAVVDGVLAGFVSTIDHGAEVEIEDLFVDPDFMRRGIASELIAIVAAATQQRLIVDANFHALDFYRHAGFVAVAEVTLEHGSATRMHRDV